METTAPSAVPLVPTAPPAVPLVPAARAYTRRHALPGARLRGRITRARAEDDTGLGVALGVLFSIVLGFTAAADLSPLMRVAQGALVVVTAAAWVFSGIPSALARGLSIVVFALSPRHRCWSRTDLTVTDRAIAPFTGLTPAAVAPFYRTGDPYTDASFGRRFGLRAVGAMIEAGITVKDVARQGRTAHAIVGPDHTWVEPFVRLVAAGVPAAAVSAYTETTGRSPGDLIDLTRTEPVGVSDLIRFWQAGWFSIGEPSDFPVPLGTARERLLHACREWGERASWYALLRFTAADINTAEQERLPVPTLVAMAALSLNP